MNPLILGPVEILALAAVREHAEAHFVDLAEFRRRAADREHVLDPGCCCVVSIGFRVAFTIERHPAGWARHLSISLATRGHLPGSPAIRMIGRALGMRMDPFDPSVTSYLEGPEGGPPRAVNVIEPIREAGWDPTPSEGGGGGTC